MFDSIIKRDGREVSFDASKIRSAIFKANSAVDGEPMDTDDLRGLTEKVVKVLEEQNLRHVEEIQDVVEEVLMEQYPKTAKAYILYRDDHAKMRKSEAELMEKYRSITFKSAHDEDIKRENANIDGDCAMGVMLKYGSEGSKAFVNNFVLPEDIAKAHVGGDIHIHDQDFYMLTETCCQINLTKLFKNGFNTGHGFLREPQSIGTAASLACIVIQANQNEMHGGQSLSQFEYDLAPYVNKTYKKEFINAFNSWMEIKGYYITEVIPGVNQFCLNINAEELSDLLGIPLTLDEVNDL